MTTRRLTPNVFSIAFGVSGLAQAWSTASALEGVPRAPGEVLWVVVALLWAGLVTAYGANVVAGGRLRSELLDPVFAPFVAIGVIVPMLLGVQLADHLRAAGVTVFAVGLVLTVLIGGWLSGQWIVSELSLGQWHPGYFLPTVAGGFLAAACCAQLGHRQLAELMFGYGAVCWLTLGSIVMTRLVTQPMLPVPLRPTMAIEMAPPVVAGAAWFGIDGGRADAVALGLAGFAVLMGLVQLRLIPVYRTVPFGVGWWAFSFSYAAVVVDALHWLTAGHATHPLAWTYVLLGLASVAFAALAARTGMALAAGTFLPAAPTVHA